MGLTAIRPFLKGRLMKILASIIVLVLIVIGGFLIVVNSGRYDVTALHPHGKMFVWMANTMVDNAVRRNAKGIMVPPLGNTAQIAVGFVHYHEMCLTCHGAPGILHSEIGEGLYPPPPDLAEAVKDWTPAELYWIIKSGFKDTGMPAFGPTHAEQDLWAITAFALRLPTMSPAQYDSLRVAARLPKPDEEGEEMEMEHSAPDEPHNQGKY
jgi:mono/diheme cytochrome c family protein